MIQGILITVSGDKKTLKREIINFNQKRSINHQVREHLNVVDTEKYQYKETTIYVGIMRNPEDRVRETLILEDLNATLYGNILIMGDIDYEGNIMELSVDNVDSFNNATTYMNSRFEEVIKW